ncbi:hypothetical protein B2G44_01200 [Candidatus Phytoplasma citri]|uniref:Uncharacterized protein n=1 Tax=Candidatus Phytoplasma citri TaxID=180978 RepID=A0A1S9M1W6_9MOLU|nr:hypothetical protein B2G44_01200 [Candidatus Phytoplasma aurantifolia]
MTEHYNLKQLFKSLFIFLGRIIKYLIICYFTNLISLFLFSWIHSIIIDVYLYLSKAISFLQIIKNAVNLGSKLKTFFFKTLLFFYI